MKLFSKIIFLLILIFPQFAFWNDLQDSLDKVWDKISSIGFWWSNSSSNSNIKDHMIPNWNTIMGESSEINWNWTSIIMTVLTEFKNIIFWLLATISIWVFIYLGYKLVIAQWKPDEFKKAMMWLVYAIVWLAIVPLAWAMVKLISSLQF